MDNNGMIDGSMAILAIPHFLFIFHISLGMYLKRDRLIRKQIEINRNSANWVPLPEEQLKKIESKAHEQLSLNKIVSREMDYSKI